LGGKDLPHLSKSLIDGIFGKLYGFMPELDKLLPPFLTLQDEHAVTIFSQVVSPPFDLGIK
jgi:hypothetical protein